MFEARGLTGPVERPFISDIDLRARPGDMIVVLGAIHSGKSLLLRHLLGLAVAERGTVTIDGDSVDAAKGSDEDWRRVRRHLGVLFERPALLRHITVVENVELPLIEHGTPPDDARRIAHSLLDEAGLDVDDDANPEELNRVEQRRVAIARALALDPSVLLLDEPTAGLDAHAAHHLDATIARLRQARGFAVIVFSHDVRHAFSDPTEILVLAHGRVIARGDCDTLLASADPDVHQLMHRRGAA